MYLNATSQINLSFSLITKMMFIIDWSNGFRISKEKNYSIAYFFPAAVTFCLMPRLALLSPVSFEVMSVL